MLHFHMLTRDLAHLLGMEGDVYDRTWRRRVHIPRTCMAELVPACYKQIH